MDSCIKTNESIYRCNQSTMASSVHRWARHNPNPRRAAPLNVD